MFLNTKEAVNAASTVSRRNRNIEDFTNASANNSMKS